MSANGFGATEHSGKGRCWKALESISSGCAVPLLWREKLGDAFETFSRAFLDRHSTPVKSFPCCRCGCVHEIIVDENSDRISPPATVYAVCRCEPWSCDTIELAANDILPLRLSWSRLGRALGRALELEARPADLHLPQTRQIGAWSSDAVPVLLTIPDDGRALRHTSSELIARLKRPFILLGPTSRWLDALCQEVLAHGQAMFLPLDQNVRLEDNGTLQALRLPGELFAQVAPQPKEEMAEKNAGRAFGLVRALESELNLRKAPILTVFRLYCMENLPVAAIARKCSCSAPIIYRRLKVIRTRLGCDPASLRRYSAQFESIERSLTHSGAKSIYRKGAAFGEEETEEN